MRSRDDRRALVGRASGPSLDVGVALLDATRVLRTHLATIRRLEHQHVAVGVAGEVRDDVADGPARQQRRLHHLLVGEVGELGLEASVRRGGTGDVAVNGVHRLRTVTGGEAGYLVHMQIAMVGLGRMGANMVRRLQLAGHECVAYDVNDAAVVAMEAEGVRGARSPQEVVDALAAPRHIWLMVPAAFVAATIASLRAAALARRHAHRRRQLVVPRRRRSSRRRSRPRASTTSTSAPAAACSASSAATA